jgi:AcrR family transcriptional regulator/L-amino acid N-acyltransferase YncA
MKRGQKDRILAAAAELLAARGIARIGRREVASAADLPVRVVSEVGRSRSDLLRAVVESLPFPPISESLQQQAQQPTVPAMQALLTAAREVLGSPAAAWDTREIQALALARYDPELGATVQHRLEQRRAALTAVVRQLRDSGAVDSSIDDEAAALHLLAVGLGLSVIAGASTDWDAPPGWTSLSARLLESLAAIDLPTAVPTQEASTWRARVTISTSPTALARLLRILALMQVTVVTVLGAQHESGEQLVDLILQAPRDLDRESLVQALSSVGTHVIVARGLADDADDIATRVLQRCAALVADPDAAPQAAADLVLADSWEVKAASQGEDTSAEVLRMQWTLDQHVVLHRAHAPFTGTEHDRASALLGLVAALAQSRGVEEGYGWSTQLHDGARLWIRLARPADAQGIADMHERCSERSRYHRYFTPMNSWRDENLRRISGGHRGATLVATNDEGEIVALGNVFPEGPSDESGAEIAVIVDDRWHRRGLGRQMLVRLVDVARRLSFDSLTAYVLYDNSGMVTLLQTLPLDWQVGRDVELGASVLCMRAALDKGSGNPRET